MSQIGNSTAGAVDEMQRMMEQNQAQNQAAGPSAADESVKTEHRILTQGLLMHLITDRSTAMQFWFSMKAGGVPKERRLELLDNCFQLPQDVMDDLKKRD